MDNNSIQLRTLDKPTEHEAGCFVCGSPVVVAYLGRQIGNGHYFTIAMIKAGDKSGTAVFCSECVGKVKRAQYNGHEVTQRVKLGHYNEVCAYHGGILFAGEEVVQSNDGRYFCSLRCADLAGATNWFEV